MKIPQQVEDPGVPNLFGQQVEDSGVANLFGLFAYQYTRQAVAWQTLVGVKKKDRDEVVSPLSRYFVALLLLRNKSLVSFRPKGGISFLQRMTRVVQERDPSLRSG